MYDELVKDLRESAPRALAEADFDFVEGWLKEAADAIEELQADNTALNGTVSNLVQQISELRKPRWISVTERLPEETETVIVTDGKNVGFSFCVNDYGTMEFYSPWKITSWMPLPQPPKEGCA